MYVCMYPFFNFIVLRGVGGGSEFSGHPGDVNYACGNLTTVHAWN